MPQNTFDDKLAFTLINGSPVRQILRRYVRMFPYFPGVAAAMLWWYMQNMNMTSIGIQYFDNSLKKGDDNRTVKLA